MIFGAKEEIIPKYYDDDKPKSAKKTAFGLVRIILLWLSIFTAYTKRSFNIQRRSEDFVLGFLFLRLDKPRFSVYNQRVKYKK